MELSFVKVLNNSISAGWLILAVLAARLMLKKAPKAIHCLLWALVAVRLLLPVSVESVFSLIPSGETVPEAYMSLEGEARRQEAVLSVVGRFPLGPVLTGCRWGSCAGPVFGWRGWGSWGSMP